MRVQRCHGSAALFDLMGDALNVLGCQRLGAARFQQAGQFLAAEDVNPAAPCALHEPTGQCDHGQRRDRDPTALDSHLASQAAWRSACSSGSLVVQWGNLSVSPS